jgi:hypothetical protein
MQLSKIQNSFHTSTLNITLPEIEYSSLSQFTHYHVTFTYTIIQLSEIEYSFHHQLSHFTYFTMYMYHEAHAKVT